MLDINFIRKNPEKAKEGLVKKNIEPKLVDKFLRLDKDWRIKISALDQLKAEQNLVSKELATHQTQDMLARAQILKKRIEEIKSEEKLLDANRNAILVSLPNLPFDTVPVGRGEGDNQMLREVGKKRKFDFEPKDHLALGEALDIFDFERGSKVAGFGFYYLKNDGVLLEVALVRYALNFLKKKGFDLWLTPDLARERFYLGTGYLPKGREAQTYLIEKSGLGLIATAEITLAGLHADEVLSELPKRYAGYSHCFRQEAGSYGKYSRGLYRVHQFTKVEMFAYVAPHESEIMHQEFLKLEEKLWRGLEIPYRVVEMCTGDLGNQAARKYDLEAWLPGRGDWGEVTSTSNTTDYQARRLNIKYRKADHSLGFVHTVNGTALATSRAIVAILENHQTSRGTIKVPKALRPYLDTNVISKK